MARIDLLSAEYTSRSIIAAASKNINLYGEINPQTAQSAARVTHYQTPGLALEYNGTSGVTRCMYRASNGSIYGIFGNGVYLISTTFILTKLGTISTTGTSPVSMGDNGLVIIVVDGTTNGFAIDMATNAFAPIKDPNWLGSACVAYLDTYLIFNLPGTNQWYISLSDASYQMFIGLVGPVTSGNISNAGTNYTNGIYTDIPFINGTGNSATGNITVSGNKITSVTLVSGGTAYVSGDILSVLSADLNSIGVIATGMITNGGNSYTDGTYTNIPLIAGSGDGAIATIIVSGGVVTAVTLGVGGVNYQLGDTLSANSALIGGTGNGFIYTVESLVTTGSGFTYTVTGTTGSAFDPLDIATKDSYPDAIVWIVVIQGYIWLVGAVTSEVWYNAGTPDFVFGRLPGVNTIEHGTSSPNSVVAQDLFPYWVKRDDQGKCMVLKGVNYQPKRISTFAIEYLLSNLTDADIDACVSYCFQQGGHTWIIFNFNSITLVYDDATDMWFQWAWTDINGNLDRHRVQLACLSNGLIIGGDWENGNIYKIDPNTFTDNGNPISRIKAISHVVEDNVRLFHKNLMLDISSGNDDGLIDGTSAANPPVINLRYSDDRGKTFGSYITQSLGSGGQYINSPQYNRLGMARDRVYEISWSAPTNVALQGVWLNVDESES